MRYKSRSRRFEALLIKAHIAWTNRALYECAGRVVHDDIGVEEDVLDSLERAFNQDGQWISNALDGKTYPERIR